MADSVMRVVFRLLILAALPCAGSLKSGSALQSALSNPIEDFSHVFAEHH